MIGISTTVQDRITAALDRVAADIALSGPLLDDISARLESAAAASFDRAQLIPLKPSTIKRKRYARFSVSHAAIRQARIPERHKKKMKRASRASLAPISAARILERVGGFIESLTQSNAEFAVRRVKTGELKFGTQLGGLWRLHGGGYSVGRKNITRVPARFDFGTSTASVAEIREGVEAAQDDFAEELLGD